jgi:hypothetical protein
MNNELTKDKEVKSKILSRIQQSLNQENGAEGMQYLKVDSHAKGGDYSKGIKEIEPGLE